MFKVEYSPQALKDFQNIQKYIVDEFGAEVVKLTMQTMTKDIRRLEMFPTSGRMLSSIIEVSTDYYYLYSKKNYVFYRIEKEAVKIIRILNEKQDYVQILFGIQEFGDEFKG